MAHQEVDTFATGGRTAGAGVPTPATTITWWIPASNGDNWSVCLRTNATNLTSLGSTFGATTEEEANKHYQEK